MSITNEKKKELIAQFGKDAKNTGSIEAQVAILTERIKSLTRHFEKHPKDHNSRRGLLKLVGKRKELLKYLRKRDDEAYKNLIAQLGLRK